MAVNLFPPASTAAESYALNTTIGGSGTFSPTAGVYEIATNTATCSIANNPIPSGKSALVLNGGSTAISFTAGFEFSTSVSTNPLFTTSNIQGSAYGNGRYVTAGDGGKVSYSTNGVNWTSVTSIGGNFFSLDFGNGLFVGTWWNGGAGTYIVTSTNGETWTFRDANMVNLYRPLVTANFGNGIWVTGGGDGDVRTSPDTITWTNRAGLGARVLASTYGNNAHVIAGNSGRLASSTDNGVNWTIRTVPFTSTEAINGLAFGNGIFVAVGAAGKLATSPDGTTWTSRTSSFGSDVINAVRFDGGQFIAVGANNKVATSRDGIIWTQRATNLTLSGNSIGIGPTGFLVSSTAAPNTLNFFPGLARTIILTKAAASSTLIGS